jgi:hypothetical protein
LQRKRACFVLFFFLGRRSALNLFASVGARGHRRRRRRREPETKAKQVTQAATQMRAAF